MRDRRCDDHAGYLGSRELGLGGYLLAGVMWNQDGSPERLTTFETVRKTRWGPLNFGCSPMNLEDSM